MSFCTIPEGHHFDVDMQDCTCGHLIGSHDYRYEEGVMVIVTCLDCDDGKPFVEPPSKPSSEVA